MKHISSAIITSQKDQSSSTGTQHGGLGLEMSSSGEVAERLARNNPADMDKLALSLMRSRGVEAAVRYDDRFPEDGPSYTVAVGCRMRGSVEAREAARSDLLKFMVPAPIRTIEGWLAELSVLCAGRTRSGMDAAVTIEAYSSRLSQYPADVARYALLKRTWKWFPTWAELEKVCESMTSPRRHMLAALDRTDPEPEPTRRPPTDEEKARVRDLIAEMFPHIPQEWKDRAVSETLKGDCMRMDAK